MATKKQKHEAAVEKRERFLAELDRTGLEARREDREYREYRKQKAEDEAKERNQRTQARIAAHNIHKETS